MAEENGNGNGFLKSLSPLLVILALVSGMSAIVAPMRQSIESVQKEAESALKWEQDYMKGQIPSSAEKDIAAMNIKFVEVETQFRNLNERTQRMETAFDAKLNSLDEKLQLEIKLEKQKP